MLFTRECDYAIRILRTLSTDKTVNVQQISQNEKISKQIVYKLARKLEKAGIITSMRGVNGGYQIKKPITEINLYMIFQAVDQNVFVTECTSAVVDCGKNTPAEPCMLHKEFCRLQNMIFKELKTKSLYDILYGECS